MISPVGVSQRVQGVFTRRHSRRDGRNLEGRKTNTRSFVHAHAELAVESENVRHSYHTRSRVLPDEGVP